MVLQPCLISSFLLYSSPLLLSSLSLILLSSPLVLSSLFGPLVMSRMYCCSSLFPFDRFQALPHTLSDNVHPSVSFLLIPSSAQDCRGHTNPFCQKTRLIALSSLLPDITPVSSLLADRRLLPRPPTPAITFSGDTASLECTRSYLARGQKQQRR